MAVAEGKSLVPDSEVTLRQVKCASFPSHVEEADLKSDKNTYTASQSLLPFLSKTRNPHPKTHKQQNIPYSPTEVRRTDSRKNLKPS